jgi:hypothetical protein
VAAFCTTRLQYLATTQRSAACSKTVRSCAFDSAWLKCSFHCLEPVPNVFSEPGILLMRKVLVKAEAAVFSVVLQKKVNHCG